MPPTPDEPASEPKPGWRRFLSLDVAAVALVLIVLLGDALIFAPRPKPTPVAPRPAVPATIGS